MRLRTALSKSRREGFSPRSASAPPWRALAATLLFLSLSTIALAQPPRGGRRGPEGRPPQGGPPPGLWTPPGKWWDNPDLRAHLGITADQIKKMDDVFTQNRTHLNDAHDILDREEAALEPMMQGSQLDDSKILAQIDRVAQARAELEKARARLLLGLRHVLNADQWTALQRQGPPPPDPAGPPMKPHR